MHMIKKIVKLYKKAHHESLSFLFHSPLPRGITLPALCPAMHIRVFPLSEQHNAHVLLTVLCSLSGLCLSRCHMVYRVAVLHVCFYGIDMNFKRLLQRLSKSTAGDQLSITFPSSHPSPSHLQTKVMMPPDKESHQVGKTPST